MSDLKKMTAMASTKKVFFIYCEGDQSGTPYLMMAPTASEIKSVKESLKKSAKKQKFAQGTVDGTSGVLVFKPKKPSKALSRDLTLVFAKEAPNLKSAVVENAAPKTKDVPPTSKKDAPKKSAKQRPDQGREEEDPDSQQKIRDDLDDDDNDDDDDDDDSLDDDELIELALDEEPPQGVLDQIPKIKAGLKLVKEGGKTRFFYCLRNENDLPELIVGKKIEPADIKRLKNGAKQKKFVRGTVELNEEKTVVFRSKNYSVRPFQKDVTTLFGKKISRLKGALFEPLGEDSVDEAIVEALESYAQDEVETGKVQSTVSAKEAHQALKKARTELGAALKNAFTKSSVPAADLAPLASAFAALEAPSKQAADVLKNNRDGEDALQGVQARIVDHERLHQALETLDRKHAAEYSLWEQVKDQVSELEGFVGGTVKEEWDLLLLTEITEKVRGPLDDARGLAFQGRYAEAAERLGDAWSLYEEGQQTAQRSGDAMRNFEDMKEVKAARAELEKIKAVSQSDFVDGIIDELRQDRTLSKQQRQDLAAQAYERLREQIRAREDRLISMRETLMGAAARGVSTEELEQNYKTFIDEELQSDFVPGLRQLATDVENAANGEGDGASNITQLEQYRAQQAQAVETKCLAPWQTAIESLMTGINGFEDRYAKLDGAGSDAVAGYRERLAALRGRGEALEKGGDIATSRKALLQEFNRAADRESIDIVRDQALKTHQDVRQAWITTVETFRTDADTLIEDLDRDLRKQAETLRQAQTQASTLLKSLRDRVALYKGYKEIPDAYTAKRDETLDGLKLYVDSSNLQSVQHAIDTMQKLLPGGKGAEFPSVPEAIAMFMATMDRQQSWYNSNDESRQEAARLVEQMRPFDFKKLQTSIETLKDNHNDLAPKLCATLETRAAELQKKLEADGISAPGIAEEIASLEKEVSDAADPCGKLTAALVTLAELQTKANKLLGSALGNWIFDGKFTGRLKTGTDAIQTEAGVVTTAGLVKVVQGKAETLIREIQEEWAKVEQESGQSGLEAHIGSQQEAADLAETRRQEAEKRRETEWEAALERYKAARKAAASKDVPSNQLDPMDSLRDTLTKTHKATKTQEVHDQTVTDLDTATDRLTQLAKNPEVFQQTAKKDLATLPKKWSEAVGRYKTGVRELITKLEGLTVSSEQATTVQKAIRTVESALELFREDAFSTSILTITLAEGEADRVKAAREQGLIQVRSYRTQINSNPALKAVLINPFARVPLTDLHKCLGDLDLNLQRCL